VSSILTQSVLSDPGPASILVKVSNEEKKD
jgi:hypothetical protein